MSNPSPTNDPLKIHLTRPWRLTLMITLIISFFILAPSLILYTSGYRFNFSSGQFSTTGVISIDTEPTDAAIYINDILVGNKQPLRLAGLAPGIYEVRISKTGYHDFNTVITLHSRETSYLKGVTLWKKSNPILQTSSSDTIIATGFTPTIPNGYYYISKQSTSTTLTLQEINKPETNSAKISVTGSLNCSTTKNNCVWWSPVTKKVNVFNLETTNEVFAFDTTTSTWQWADDKNTLGFLETKTGLQKIDLDHANKPVRFSTSGLWFIGENEILFSASNSILEQKTADNQKVSVVLPQPLNQIITGNSNFALVRLSEHFEIITNLPTIPNHQTIRADQFFYDPDATRWLVWSPWEITSIDAISGNHGFLYRSAEPLQFVQGLEPEGSIVIITNNTISAFNPGYITTQELANFTKIQAISVDQKNRTILIAGSQENQSGIFTLTY